MRKESGIAVGICMFAAAVMLFGAARTSWAADEGLVTLAGIPGTGTEDGMGEEARFAAPLGIDVKGSSVLIADTDNNRVRSWHGNRVVSVVGNSQSRDAYGRAIGGYADGSNFAALLNRPADCLYLDNDRVAVADRENHAIRIIGSSWVYTLAGTGEAGYQEKENGNYAKFSSPSGLAADQNGNIYVADTGNHCIRKITKSGATSLVAGVPGTGGLQDGAWDTALFLEPEGIAVADDGTIYVADTGNQRIRKISGGQVTTVAGGSTGTYLDTEYRQPGYRDGKGTEAMFWFPRGICVAGTDVLVADTGNHVIRVVHEDGTVETIAGTGDPGYQDGAPLEAELHSPADLAWKSGTLYIMDTGNSALRKMRYRPSQQEEELLEE